MWDSGNSFFNGPFEPWHHETSTYDLEVIGQIPRELNGALYRGSANQHVRPPKPERHHQFEGNGMIYAVFLRDGKAHCTNRWVRTASFDAEAEAGRGLYGSVMNGGSVPDPSVNPPFKNASNTNVMLIDDRLLVFQEIDLPHQLHRLYPSPIELGDFVETMHWSPRRTDDPAHMVTHPTHRSGPTRLTQHRWARAKCRIRS